MTSDKVRELLRRCLGHEGGYWDDPVGGPTKWGVSQRSYPHLNIKNLTIDQAGAIYIADYIIPMNLDRFPRGLAFQLFDFGVNSGPKTAIKQLQQALGLKDDGIVGPITRAKIDDTSDSDLVMLILAERLDFMADCKNFLPNARGWVKRIAQNLRYGADDTD